MPHHLEFFSAGCPLCAGFLNEVELGKCGSCTVEVVDVRRPESRSRLRRYGVRVTPTLVIDGRIKVEGRLDEPWVCGDEFYRHLEERYPLRNARLDRGSK